MHLHPLVPMGLALFVSTGCQSYFPYGYGNTNPYPSVSGTYTPQRMAAPGRSQGATTLQPESGQSSIPSNGTTSVPTGQNRGQSPKGQNQPVPKYTVPGGIPSSLGAPASDDEADSIRHGTSSLDRSTDRGEDSGDDSDEALSSVDGENFLKPTPFRQTSATADEPDIRRAAAAPSPSPYRKDPNGYKWLRGVVSRDPKNNSWRITYSRKPLDKDPFNGALTLVDDELFDTLMDDDVVWVEGSVDRSVLDRYGKPSYRVTKMSPPLSPKDE